MKYAFIRAQEAEFGVERLCRVLGVGRSGYYAWRDRPASRRAQADQALLTQIHAAYQTSRATYGSPRVYHALRAQGVACGRHRVARLMRQAGLVAHGKRKFHPRTTQPAPHLQPAPNRLGQAFSAEAPNRKWVVDFTYLPTGEGWLYLAVVPDLFSRRVVGWAMSERMETALVVRALRMALQQRHPPAGLLHHSDRGSQYTSGDYRACLQSALAELSMSGTGNCYDNAVAESFLPASKPSVCPGPLPPALRPAPRSLNTWRFGTIDNASIPLWAMSARSNLNDNSPFKSVHKTGARSTSSPSPLGRGWG